MVLQQWDWRIAGLLCTGISLPLKGVWPSVSQLTNKLSGCGIQNSRAAASTCHPCNGTTAGIQLPCVHVKTYWPRLQLIPLKHDQRVIRKHLELINCWCCMWSEVCCRSPQARSCATSHPWSVSEAHAVSSPSTTAPQQLSLQNRWPNDAEGAGKMENMIVMALPAVIQHLQQVYDLIIHPDVRPIGNNSAHYWTQEVLS